MNELREATHNPSESTDNSASLPSVSTVSAPGQGLSKTRSRNQRRAAQKKRERLERVNGTIENITTENVTTENVTTENVTTDNADMADLPRYERIKKSTIEIDIDISDLLEKKRQALLEDVAQTKVKSDSRNESPDEEAGTPFTDEASNQPSTQEAQTSGDPKTLAIRTAEESSPVGPIPTSETPKPRARLDLQSTRRLLFGSLGVRNPKTPADEEKLRTKMMENVRKPIAKPVIQTPKPSVDDELIDDSWKDAIELKAVECCYDGVELTTPPFPFFQRWDAQQQGFGNRLNEERGKKRKRNHNQYYEDSQDIAENSFSRNFSTEGESINPPEESTNRSSQTDKNDASAPKCDLPTLPVDIDSYPLLTNGTALPGAIIAFKQMQCSEDTKWQPTISDYQAGIIDSVLDDGRFGVKLVNASQRSGKKRFDPQTGQRLYAKFEMPGVDDDTDEASGILELAFTDMIGAKLTKMAAEISKEPHDAEPHTTTSAADALVQTSPLQTAAEYNAANAASIKPNTPPRLDETANKEISVKASRQIPDLEDSILLSASVPSVDNTATLSPRAEPREEPAVSSQAPQSVSETTREEISALVKDAGFRSSVASEIREGLTVDLPAISVAIPPVAFDGNNSMIPTDSTDQVVSEDHNTRNQISSPFLSPSDAIDYSLGGETAVPTNDDSFLNDDDWESIESNDNAPLYPRLSSQIDNVEDVEEDSGPEDFQDAWENTNALNEESGSDFKPPKRRRSSRLSSSQEPQPIRSKGRGLRSKSMAMFSNADPSSSSPAPARATRSKTARNSKLFGSPSIKSSPLPSPRGSTLEASSSSKRLQTIQDEDSSDSLIEPSVLFREPRLPPPRRSQGTASASQSQRPPEGAKIIDLTGVSSDPVIPMNTPSPSKKASKGKKGKKSRKS